MPQRIEQVLGYRGIPTARNSLCQLRCANYLSAPGKTRTDGQDFPAADTNTTLGHLGRRPVRIKETPNTPVHFEGCVDNRVRRREDRHNRDRKAADQFGTNDN
jgi:hypothetical protein